MSSPPAAAEILHHPDLNAANTFENPGAIVARPHPIQVSGSSAHLDLCALSALTATIQV